MLNRNTQRITELTKYLNKCRDEYYNDAQPTITDELYDELVAELESLEKAENFRYFNSPTQTVGYTVNENLPKVKHDHPLLSLEKTKDYGVAATFTGEKCALIMDKLDGLTICLTYDNGELVEASTRGNGFEGSLITDNAKTFWNLPEKIAYKKRLKIVGEGIIHKDDFARINAGISNPDDRYKTPRNLAGGSVQLLDSGICATRKIYFYAFNVIDGLYSLGNLSNRLLSLGSMGFDFCPFFEFYPDYEDMKSFRRKVDMLVNGAKDDGLPIDGIVIMYDNIKYGNSLGKTGHHYKNGIALKFKEEEEESILRDVEWQVGRTGKITPVAVFDPVTLDNTEVTKASLHNVSVMEKLGIKLNSRITVIKSNEIIPQVIRAKGGTAEIAPPTVCPVCGAKIHMTSDDGVKNLYCDSPDCRAKLVRKLAYFADKDGMNIDGLSEKRIEQLVDAGIVTNFLDLYNLDNQKEKIVALEGMGEKSYEKLITAIERSRDVELENFITALGIPNVALSKAKVISRRFGGDWYAFENAVKEGFDFTELESIGDEIARCINEYFNGYFWHNSFLSLLVALMRFQPKEKEDGCSLEGLIFAITGDLNVYSNRRELQKEIESLGGKVAGSVSKKTSYLINNDPASPSSKNKSAIKNNVQIITEMDFINMLKGEKDT